MGNRMDVIFICNIIHTAEINTESLPKLLEITKNHYTMLNYTLLHVTYLSPSFELHFSGDREADELVGV